MYILAPDQVPAKAPGLSPSLPSLCLWLREPRDAAHSHQGAAPGSRWSLWLTSTEIAF